MSPLRRRRFLLASLALALSACSLSSSTRFRSSLEQAVQEFDGDRLNALVAEGARPIDAPALPSLALAEAASRPEGCFAPTVGPHLTKMLEALAAQGWGFEENPKNLPGIRKDLSLALDVLCPPETVALIAARVPLGDATRASFALLEVAARVESREKAGKAAPGSRAAVLAIRDALVRFHQGHCTTEDRQAVLPPPSCRFLDSVQADANLKALSQRPGL